MGPKLSATIGAAVSRFAVYAGAALLSISLAGAACSARETENRMVSGGPDALVAAASLAAVALVAVAVVGVGLRAARSRGVRPTT